MITHNDLRAAIHYDPVSGVFTRTRDYKRWKKGDMAGHVNARGYRIIRINGNSYRASRLAWLYMTGSFPNGQIDHRNRNKKDDRFENLREVSPQENALNRIRFGKSGVPGVHIVGRRWRSSIRVNGKLVYLGSFGSPDLAKEAYRKAKIHYHQVEFLPGMLIGG